jgi:hypothetical protein
LQLALEEKLTQFHPHTVGLIQFMRKYDLGTSAATLAPIEKIEAALRKEFSTEAILKPTTVINTGGETGLYLFSTKSILEAFEKREQSLMTALERQAPFKSELIDRVASGEEFLLQENIASIAGYEVLDKAKQHQEVRIHTYEDQVIRGGSFSRWSVNEIKNQDMFYWAQDFVQEFLNTLPKDFLVGQAWGLDLLVFENKVIRILEINTNRGEKGQWTGFLSRPQVMGAYTRMIEQKKDVRFAGFSGFLLRNNFGNITKHLKKKYIEGIR